MTAATLVPSIISGVIAIAATITAYRGSRRETMLSNEHRLIDQLQEERNHWQARAQAAEDLLLTFLPDPEPPGR